MTHLHLITTLQSTLNYDPATSPVNIMNRAPCHFVDEVTMHFANEKSAAANLILNAFCHFDRFPLMVWIKIVYLSTEGATYAHSITITTTMVKE